MDHERVQVPVDVAVEEPRAGVVREEPDCNVITGVADAHDIAEDRIIKVVCRVTSAAYNSKGMSMQVNGMLFGERIIQIGETLSPDDSAEYYSRVRRWHQPGWSVPRSCSARDRRYCLRELGPTLSSHRSGSGVKRGYLEPGS
jgi:hypothetical protein